MANYPDEETAMRLASEQDRAPPAEKTHFERWCDIIAQTPSGRTIQPVEEAAKDGSSHLFRVVLDLEAFWCDDAKRWVLTRPLNLDYLPTQADHIPKAP